MRDRGMPHSPGVGERVRSLSHMVRHREPGSCVHRNRVGAEGQGQTLCMLRCTETGLTETSH